MTREELETVHEKYEANSDEWRFFGLAYSGGRAFIEEVIDRKSIRESDNNFAERQEEAINFNYCASIVDLFNFYLTEKDVTRELKSLSTDTQWQMFLSDCDLTGTNYDTYLNEAQKLASAYGSVGILVDKAKTDLNTVEAEISAGVYPYLSLYTLPHILDWEHDKDPISGRPRLKYLKLKDSSNVYRIWTLDRWEVWQVDESNRGAAGNCSMIDDGPNTLGEIPFIWAPNMTCITDPYLGISDIKDISYIVASIVRNISMGDEIIKFAGFPMMRKPMVQQGMEDEEDVVGVSAVTEFDPQFGEGGKPDWMETKILEPVEAILKWIDRKVDEAFRVAHLSGVHGQRKSNNEVASGLALRYEFQQLKTVLTKKAESLNEAERRIIYFWLKWQNREELAKGIEIKRSKNFSINDLADNLENLILAAENVRSTTFVQRIQEAIAKSTLPDMSDVDVDACVNEIRKLVKEPIAGAEETKVKQTWLSNRN